MPPRVALFFGEVFPAVPKRYPVLGLTALAGPKSAFGSHFCERDPFERICRKSQA